jgi:hypothetical protein
MSLLLEVLLLGECGAEQIMMGVAGLAKVGDLVSDIFFINTLSEFNGIFGEAQNELLEVPIKQLLAFAIIFTFVGVVFEVQKIYKFLKDRRERLERKDQDDENEEQEEDEGVTESVYLFLREKLKECREKLGRGKPNDKEDGGEVEHEWEMRPFPLNLILEDLPQLIILCITFARVNLLKFCDTKFDFFDDDTNLGNCTEQEEEFTDELYFSVYTSAVFTGGIVCYTLFRMCRGRMRWRPDCRKVNGGDDNGLHAEDTTDAVSPTSHMSSSSTDENFLRVDTRADVETTVHPADGSETIRTE